MGERRVFSAQSGWVTAQIYDRQALPSGSRLPGPAVVHQRDTTTFVPAGVEASVDAEGNLVLSIAGAAWQAAEVHAAGATSRASA